jgi:hypothetical protein
MPFSLVYHDRDQQLTIKLDENPVVITRDEADVLADHLRSFVQDMDRTRKPKPAAEGADHEVHGEMLMAQYDDDPNPYHGDYSED